MPLGIQLRPGPELLFGPLLIGTILSTLFYGVMAAHMFTYYQRFKNDRQWIRYLLLYIFIIESLRIVVQVAITYQPLVVEFGSQQALIVSPLFVPGDAATLVLISTPVQIFTGWRISVITGRRYLWALIAVLALVSLGGGFSVSIFSGIRNEFQEFATFNNAVILWFISSAVCDVFIAVILTHSLSTRKTGFGVDTQINRIIRVTVQTGAITACGAIAVLVVFLVLPTTTLQFIVDFPLSKFYSISLVATLNARANGRTDKNQRRQPNALFMESTEHSTHSGTRELSGGVGGGMRHTTVHVYPPSGSGMKSPPYAGSIAPSAVGSAHTLVAPQSLTPKASFTSQHGAGGRETPPAARHRPRSMSQPHSMMIVPGRRSESRRDWPVDDDSSSMGGVASRPGTRTGNYVWEPANASLDAGSRV